MIQRGWRVLVVASVLACAPAWADLPKQAAVASAHPLATEVGQKVLSRGGNACDAAAAITAALAVVEPYGSGLGGGGFYLIGPAEGDPVMLDAREVAPQAASRDMYLDRNGKFVRDRAIDGPLAAGIPGTPAALDYLSRECGSMPLDELLAPAIELAQEGVPFDDKLIAMLRFRREAVAASPAAAEIFFNSGDLPTSGEILVQQDLAATLKAIAEDGAEAFYRGDLAETLVAGVSEAGGIWQLQDLADYRVVERKPVVGQYRGMRVTAASPPSSGGVVLMQMLNILARFPADWVHAGDHRAVHLQVEAMRRAYRDRAAYLGDPDFVDMPLERLLDPRYAAGLAASIRLDRATPSEALPGLAPERGGRDTTHFSVIDKQGNRVAATLSINYPFGSGFIAPGTGVLLNDEMDDFASKPGEPNVYGLVGGEANAIEPGKRMLSSMTPTFLEHDDRLAVLGTPGGSRIITMVLRAALDFYRGEEAASIVAAPRLHHQFRPDEIEYEPGALDRNQQLELQLKGHRIKEMSRSYGNMQLLIWNRESGEVSAASDPRGHGRADIGSYLDKTEEDAGEADSE
ncbi:MAG: gamma-glutamyltransferase [Pseudomonadota bacterium]